MGASCCGASSSTPAPHRPPPSPYADWASRIAEEHRGATAAPPPAWADAAAAAAPSDVVRTTLRDLPRLPIGQTTTADGKKRHDGSFEETTTTKRKEGGERHSPSSSPFVASHRPPSSSETTPLLAEGRLTSTMAALMRAVGDDPTNFLLEFNARREGGDGARDMAATLKDAACFSGLIQPFKPPPKGDQGGASENDGGGVLVSNSQTFDVAVCFGQSTMFHVAQRCRFLFHWPWVEHVRETRWNVAYGRTNDAGGIVVVHTVTMENFVESAHVGTTPPFQAEVCVTMELKNHHDEKGGDDRKRFVLSPNAVSLRVTAFRAVPPPSPGCGGRRWGSAAAYAERYDRMVRDVFSTMELHVGDWLKK